jgi:hypothetical protein
MKCEKHNYGYDDLPLEELEQPTNECNICWAVYALNNGSGEIAPYNIDTLESVFAEFAKAVKGD